MFKNTRFQNHSRTMAIVLGTIVSAGAAPAVADDKSELADQVAYTTTFQHTRFQTANVFDALAGPGVRHGAAWLVRSRHGIQGRIAANVPTAGDPYTVWVSVYNNPSACATTPCSPADFANPAVGASVFYGSGAISSDNGLGGGVIDIDFSRLSGRLPKDLAVLTGKLDGLGRGNGFKAEIHVVIHQHPPIANPADSWIEGLTTSNLPGAGPNKPVRVAQFVGCPQSSCPASVR